MINKNKTSIIISICAILFLSIFLNVSAETKLNWENPNATGRSNPYRFKFTDVVNSQVMMQVVGCTGVVNKVSEAITGLFQSADYKEKIDAKELMSLENQCFVMQIAMAMGLSSVPFVNVEQPVLEAQCKTLKSADTDTKKELAKQYKIAKENKFREECLNGIAVTLAKNQLTAMTRSTMNWVATGFNGDPMYVRNMNSFMQSIEDRIVNEELEFFQNADPNAYPYGRDFARSYYNSYTSGKNFRDSMSQTLTNHLSDGRTIEDYTYDFSAGGWEAWLGLTQEPQNNPIGYAIETSNYISNKQQQEVENTKQELIQGNGIFNQKKCVEYKKSVYSGQTYEETTIVDGQPVTKTYNMDGSEAVREDVDVTNPNNCVRWENISPGSVIQDKISTYINSPERQLELADTINEGLNALFSALIDKYRQSGLTGIGSNLGTDYADYSGGYGSNSSTYSINSGSYEIGVDSAGYNRPFNLTKDLGNTYIRANTTEVGKWDASSNTIKDKNGVIIKNEKGANVKLIATSGSYNTTAKQYTATPNVYYTVTTPGKTKLFDYGSSNWEEGDRAFWDGEKWQNWKKKGSGTIDLPIEKRGVIQIQEDYVAASKELLSVLPGVMPKLGELDYCIPGPNPNWLAASLETEEAFDNFINAINGEFVTGKNFLQRNHISIRLPKESSKEWLNFQNMFTDSDLWDDVMKTSFWSDLMNENLANGKNSDGTYSYTYWGGSEMAEASDKLVKVKEYVLNNINNGKKQYAEYVENTYGSKSAMLRQYNKYENTSVPSKNLSYLEMAPKGISFTKNILIYDEQVDQETELYKDEIVNLEANIYQLELMRKQVNEIIKKAQERRDINREKILTEIQEVNKVSRAEAERIYKECSEQEEIYYLDSDSIVGLDSEANRCSDGLDNDLDGYIDQNDFDCNKTSNQETGRSRSSGVYNTGSLGTSPREEEEDDGPLEVKIIE